MSRALLASYALTTCALLALTACSLGNDPVPLPLPPQDGGVQSDAGDGGNVDGGPICRAREICFNAAALPSVPDGLDDDCDGATGCADLDCANEARCCDDTAGPVLFSEDWSASNFGLRWTFAPPDSAGTLTLGSQLRGFGADGLLRSIMRSVPAERCVPLALGARIELAFDGSRCTGACTDEAAILLTGADTPARGVGLAADLRVAVGADGALSVTSGGTPIVTSPGALGAGGRVVIEISPTARDGVAVLAARIETGPVASARVVVADGAFIAQSLLRNCDGGPGLALAVEGRGSTVWVEPLTVTPLSCTNPRIFATGGETVTATNVGAASGWTSGGISAPALLPETGALHLFYDATNVERDLERTAPIDFAIGGADAAAFGSGWMPLAAGDAYVGTTPPACTTPPCSARASMREPTASASYNPGTRAILGGTELFAFALESAADPDVFSIAYVNTPPVRPTAPIALLDPPAGCVSVRDPGFAQASDISENGLWMFYTCVRASQPSTIRAVTLDPGGVALVVRSGTDTEVLTPSIGAYAARGVSAPAGIVRVVPGIRQTLAVRLWFVAHGADGRRSVALAEGQLQLEPGAAVDEAVLPLLAPYPANPLLRGDSPQLPPCGGVCDVRDVGIGRIPNSTALTLLVARRVDRTAGGTLWELIPLVQTLEAAWWGTP